MPRAKKRPMRARAREDLSRGVMRKWDIGDSPSDVALKLQMPRRRVLEALEYPTRHVCRLAAHGEKLSDICRMTGYPSEFVLWAMKLHYAYADKQRRGAGSVPLKMGKAAH